jgi:hypothetical protein
MTQEGWGYLLLLQVFNFSFQCRTSEPRLTFVVVCKLCSVFMEQISEFCGFHLILSCACDFLLLGLKIFIRPVLAGLEFSLAGSQPACVFSLCHSLVLRQEPLGAGRRSRLGLCQFTSLRAERPDPARSLPDFPSRL